MLSPLLKICAPLVLLLALLLLGGGVSLATALAGSNVADSCCRHDCDSRPPTGDGECADSQCRCLFCSVPLLFHAPLIGSTAAAGQLFWLWSRFIPAAPVRLIEYPPESA
jgi:hypothetical protein